MTRDAIIRAWKDETFRAQLDEQAPDSPAGAAELPEDGLHQVAGGTMVTIGGCPTLVSCSLPGCPTVWPACY